MAIIIIPTPLRKFTNNESQFYTEASTVQEAIENLTTNYSELGQHLLDDNHKIRSFIKVYVGEDDIDDLDKGKTEIGHETIVSIVPAIAGGI